MDETVLDVYEELNKPSDPVENYVEMTLNSGVAPLEMRFCQINGCYNKLPIAYRSFTYINSVMQGVIPPEKYSYASDNSDRGQKLAAWNITEAMSTVQKLEQAGRRVSFVTARCPAKLTLMDDMYAFVKDLMDKNGFETPEKLCLEFPKTLMYEDPEKVRPAILSMKLLKVKTMMTGCGDDDCPVTPLINVPVDYVLLPPGLTKLVTDRNKSAVIVAFLAFLRSMQIDVIADGALDNDQISALNRADCVGYVPSPDYIGDVEHGRLRMTLDEAVSQSGGEEMY